MSGEAPDHQESAPVIVEARGSLAIVRLNRPDTRNSLSLDTLNILESTVADLTARRDVSAIIFTGTGDAFASGANIKELRRLTPDTARDFARRGQRLMQLIDDAAQLTIAAINGYCMGGGLDLALACDLRCASPDAVFAHPGAQLGIITGWGGTQRLPRLIGATRALEMFLTTRRISSREAFEIGLINFIGDPVIDHACEWATTREKSL